MQNELQTLMQKDMDRKLFLKHIGIGFAAIIGVTSVLKTIAQLNGNRQRASLGYSGGAYGGDPHALTQPSHSLKG